MKFVVLALAFIGAASAGYVSPLGGLGYGAWGHGAAIAPVASAYSAPIAAGYHAPITAAPIAAAYHAPTVAAYGQGYAAPAIAGYGHAGYAAPGWGYGGLWKKKASA